jgi:hypothetical protein
VARLLGERRLPRFLEVYGNLGGAVDGLGDCHEVTLALMVDLLNSGAANGWLRVTGTIKPDVRKRFKHSWLECDGWAIDPACGKFVVTDLALWEEIARPRVKHRWTADQLRAALLTGRVV